MKAFVKAAKALGDPARVTILKMLEVKPMCVCEVRSVLGLAQSTVSKHLKVLEEAGLVTWERDGPWVNYALARPDDSPAGRMLALLACLDGDPAIARARETAARANRGQILSSLPSGGETGPETGIARPNAGAVPDSSEGGRS